jgi:hypothetical protein
MARLVATLIGWTLVPFFAAGRLLSLLLPRPYAQKGPEDNNTSTTYWKDFTDSYDAASKDVVGLWLKAEGLTIEKLLEHGLTKATARGLTLNLMAGVREGFIDPGFAHCLTYALSCAVIEGKDGESPSYQSATPSWPCEYCIFFRGLKDIALPEPHSSDPQKRAGNKLGECEKRGAITMKGVPPGSCDEFTLEKRRRLKLLKRTNEELQLWYLIHRHDAPSDELQRVRAFRHELKKEIQKETRKKRRRRATDYSYSQR